MQHIIPHNHKGGQLIAGTMIKTRNLFEAFLLAIIPFAVIMQFKFISDFTVRLTIAIIVSMIPAALGIFGLNGDSLSVFIFNWIKFRNNKRIALYNPRIKSESKPAYEPNNIRTDQLLPRDRIMLFFKDLQKKRNAKEIIKKAVSSDTVTENTVFFEDDIGILEVPEEYKTDKELKKEAKKRKHAVKKQRKGGK